MTDRTKAVVDDLGSPLITYVLQAEKGLCRAKNLGIEMAGDGIVASIDDDETADPHWLAELARGFAEHPEADAVTGVMAPGELETWAQVWFEQYGGHNKLRGFTPAVFSPQTAHVQSPLYPLPSFGSGGNVAFRTSSLARIGGFDIALGPGTRQHVERGHPGLHGSSLLGRNRRLPANRGHPSFSPAVRGGAPDADVGLRSRPDRLLRQPAGRSAPLCPGADPAPARRRTGICSDAKGLQSSGLPPDFPEDLLRAKRRGMFIGPVSYVRARLDAARFKREAKGAS